MAVAVQMDFEGAGTEQYDQVIGKMGFSPGGPGPAGCLSHFAAKTPTGMHIVDVWESKEQFEMFAQEQIGPYSAEAGITQQPKTEFFEVHNYLTAGP